MTLNLTARVLPKFPVRTGFGPGVKVTKANGIWNFSLDYPNLAPDLTFSDPSNTWIAIHRPDQTYARTSVSAIAAIGAGVFTLEAFGAVGGDVVRDTAALQAAMAIPNIIIEGGGKEYYIGQGALCAAGSFIRNIRLKGKLGPGGFSSVETLTTRYDIGQTMLKWDGVDGGGYQDIEIYGDGGGDYLLLGICARLGFQTRPFIGRGICYIHDIVGYTGGYALNSIGAAGFDIDTIKLKHIGTNAPANQFTRNGLPLTTYGSAQVTGFAHDGDRPGGVNSKRGTIKIIYAEDMYQGGAAFADKVTGGGQIDAVTFAGGDSSNPPGDTPNDRGPYVGYIYCDGTSEVVDCQSNGVMIGMIEAKNVSFEVLKIVHGAKDNTVGVVRAIGPVARAIVGINAASPEVCSGNRVLSVEGWGIGEYIEGSGTAQAGTAGPPGTITLQADEPPYDDWYNPTFSYIRLDAGAGAGLKEYPVTAYNGTTKVLTIFGAWAAGTPNNTTQYTIRPFSEHRNAVNIEGDPAALRNNLIIVNGVRDEGHLAYIARKECNGSFTGNVIIINKDEGFITNPVDNGSTGRGVAFRVGDGAKALTRMTMGAVQNLSTVAETQVNFDTVAKDTYWRAGGGAGLQADTVNKGIRMVLPGLKRFSLQLTYSLTIATEKTTVAIKRNGVTVFRKTHQFAAGTGSNTATFTGTMEHEENFYPAPTAVGLPAVGNDNLYTVTVQHTTAGAMTITNAGTDTWFEMTDL